MKKFTTVTTQELSLLICDSCGVLASIDDTKFHEFICVQQMCGYGSIHNDGYEIAIDLCKHCFARMCGDILSITDLHADFTAANDCKTIEYHNRPTAITQSKKRRCDTDERKWGVYFCTKDINCQSHQHSR
ncbi:hypothetical protein [Colwellia sp. MB3u-4]|uniref:hypothetical protein n=1 Tax=Colwellia sp. MB3u-4 TaxID=2759822 RepID=UPI0015F481A5|nr:hypothetical protein [Colwellia sp. MB3u-4]MBA6289245.1 hypothetical protein [Colwellia sp. MB3u-4]